MDKQLSRIAQVVGYWAIPLGLVVAALSTFKPHWAIWVCASVWIVCAMATLVLGQTEQRRARLIKLLSDPTYRHAYRATVVRPMRRLWRKYADRAPHGTWLFRATLTWRTYDVALRIAVSYPVVLLLGPWLIWGGDVALNGEVLQAGTAQWWHIWPERAPLLGAFALLILAFILPMLAS
ncbi:MAG: hypothetical protein ABJJ92_16640, partial [Tateyamaria sp.]